ncbi:hypothetical protein HZS_3920 [Henneguya salminicola]|nr:hypothetical protein HZS_3920 [Henneguya salminicola]
MDMKSSWRLIRVPLFRSSADVILIFWDHIKNRQTLTFGHPIKPIGVSDVQVAKEHKTFTGSLFICHHGPNILGRDWFT